MLVAKRSGQAGEKPRSELDVLLGERGEPLLEKRDELMVVSGPRRDESPGVAGRSAGKRVR